MPAEIKFGAAGPGLIVGYALRFLPPESAATVAGVAAGQGVHALLSEVS